MVAAESILRPALHVKGKAERQKVLHGAVLAYEGGRAIPLQELA
jgi:hypothetical protein